MQTVMVRSWMARLLLPVTISVAPLVGCAGLPRGGRSDRSRIIDAPSLTVWKSAIELTGRMGYRIRSADERRGTVIAEREDHDSNVSRYVADPVGGVQNRRRSLSTVPVISIAPVFLERTRGLIDARFVGCSNQVLMSLRRDGPVSTMVPLCSNGALEREFFDRVAVVAAR